jgi:hypothetical protein
MLRSKAEKRSQGAAGYMLILAVALVITAAAIYYVTRPSFPAIAATEAKVDNTIRIEVTTGSIEAGEWQYSVSSASGNYDWTDGAEALDSPSVSLGAYDAGTWYVSLKHKASGHIYFSDRVITIE